MSSSRFPLSARPAFLPDEISRREFATVFRGYDAAEVRTFLNQLAEQQGETADRIAEIQKALSETEDRVKNPELDEETVTRLLGEQTAQVLRSAREAANETRSKAEAEVSRSLREAHEVTTKMREEAETILSERTEEAERLAEQVRTEAAQAGIAMRSSAEQEAAEIRKQVAEEAAVMREQVEKETEQKRAETEQSLAWLREATAQEVAEERAVARRQATEFVEAARSEAQALVARTQERQTELIEGLVRKRKIALAQVEELRAGRQRLLQAYKMVRGTLDDVTAELERVEDEARRAAEQAGTRAAQTNELQVNELDTVVELEEFRLDDDVPASVLDLATEESGSNGNGSGISHDVHGEGSGVSTGSGDGGQVATINRQETMLAGESEDLDFDEYDDAEIAEDVNQIRSTSSSFIIGESSAQSAGNELDEALQARRQAVVDKAKSQAARRLRRSLQEEQDALVGRVRSGDGESVQALLGSPEDQAVTYMRSVVKLFREVVRTGVSSVEGKGSIDKNIVDRTGTTAARGMAAELVSDLRSQLQPVIDDLLAGPETPDMGTLQSVIGAPYETVSGPYLDQLIEDRIGGAFDQGLAFAR